jgi:hypothetical protein
LRLAAHAANAVTGLSRSRHAAQSGGQLASLPAEILPRRHQEVEFEVFSSSFLGAAAAALWVAGLGLGSRLGCAFGKRMEVVGGIILIGIGPRVVISHTIIVSVI